MTQSNSLSENISKDIASFADPGTDIRIEPERDGLFRATWYQSGKRRVDLFLADEGAPWPDSVRIGGGHIAYASFLASTAMADLHGIARNTGNVIEELDDYVSLEAVAVDSESEGAVRDSSDLIRELAIPGNGRTNVVFVTADAGVGKTSLLRHLVRQKAVEYLRGASGDLWLYVDAQGRRLAQLDDAIAAELDNVRARFPYHAATPLVRSGALILVVDGFDELIGSVGSYDEAFSSLANFISDLNGFGCIVAAARSAYYEQEFLTRTTSTSLADTSDSWSLQAVRLLDWSNAKRHEYLDRVTTVRGLTGHEAAEKISDVESVLAAIEVRNVGRKAFFVSRTLDILLEGSLPTGTSLLDRLVTAYVQREVETKLLSPATATPMLDSEQYQLLLSEIAEEMWLQETRELSRVSIREITEIIGSAIGLSGDHLREIIERLPYGALLARGSISGSVAFEHDIFYSYFLAEPISRAWSQADARDLARILRRGRLPEEAASLTGRLLRNHNVQERLDALRNAISKSSGDVEQVRRNAGALTGGLLESTVNSDLSVRDLIFGDVRLSDAVIRNSRFINCSFAGTSLSDVKFERCSSENVMMSRVLVTPGSTILDIDGLRVPDFHGLVIRTPSSSDRWVFSPQDIRETLAECNLPDAGDSDTYRRVEFSVILLIDRLCHCYLKTNVLTEEDVAMVRIVADPKWREIKKALVDSGTLIYETRGTGGNKMFLRRTVPPQDIMLGLVRNALVPDSIFQFWEVVERTYPEH